jgi:hypothetical protein
MIITTFPQIGGQRDESAVFRGDCRYREPHSQTVCMPAASKAGAAWLVFTVVIARQNPDAIGMSEPNVSIPQTPG